MTNYQPIFESNTVAERPSTRAATPATPPARQGPPIDASLRAGQVLSDENAALIQEAHAHIKAVADEAGVDLALGDTQNASKPAEPGTQVAEVQSL